MDMVLEFLRFVILVIGGTGLMAFMVFAVIVSSQDIEARRKAWRSGTHDYYGNKLNDDQ